SAAAAAVACSFLVIGHFATPGHARESLRLTLLRWPAARALADYRTRALAQAVSVALLVLIVAAGLCGNQNPTRNLAPTAIWIAWWVGLAYVSALVGNVWAVINPWSAAFHWVERLVARHSGEPLSLGFGYPERFGVWPATVLFTAFAWTELVFTGRAIPAELAMITVTYSLITWTGMLVFGRPVWLAHGDPFSVAF